MNIKAEPSTRFADWIETNLLKVEAAKIRRVVFDNYKIQEDPDRPGSGPDAEARREIHDQSQGFVGALDDGRVASGPGAERGQASHHGRRRRGSQDRRCPAQAVRA